MDDMIAPIVDDLTRALGVDRETLEKELTMLIVDYRVPPEEARRSILKKYRSVDAAAEGQPVPADNKPRFKPLADIRNGDTGINVIGRVIEPRYRDISTQKGDLRVINGMLEDGTARVYFTCWVDVPDIFNVNSIIAKKVYVKSFQGIPGINITESSVLEEYAEELPPYKSRRMSVGDLLDTDGVYDVDIEGDIVSIRPGSGVIERCTACNRVMQKGQCRAHGRSVGIWDMRIKAVLDDGTGSVICVFDRDITGTLLSTSIGDLLKRSESPEKVEERIKTALIGMPLVVRGHFTRGDYGSILVASSAKKPETDMRALARELIGSMK